MVRRIVKPQTEDVIKKIGMVSRNYKINNDFSNFLPNIIDIADKTACDTLIYSMWSLDDTKQKLTHDKIFGHSKNIKRVVLETGDFSSMSNIKTEIWLKGNAKPKIIIQRFAKASDDSYKKPH